MNIDKAAANPVPHGYHTITPWIITKHAADLITFLENVFNAQETPGSRFYNADGSIGHVEVRIGDSVVMLFDSKETWPTTPAFLRIYVEDANATYRRALEAGATPVTEVAEHFFGDRIGRVRDPAGNVWWLQSHIEDVDPKEMGRRMSGVSSFTDAMRDAQETLDRELRGRNRD